MPRKLAPCGTETAYQRHIRRSEPVDEKCRVAHNDHLAAKRGYKTSKDKEREAAQKAKAVQDAKDRINSELEQINELEDLIYTRKVLLTSIEAQMNIDPAKVAPLTKELRYTHEKISKLKEQGETQPEQKEVTFNELLSSIKIDLPQTP